MRTFAIVATAWLLSGCLAVPLQQPHHAGQAPIVKVKDSADVERDLWHVGADVQPSFSALPRVALTDDEDMSHGTAEEYYGTETDGVSRTRLLAYLQVEASDVTDGLIRWDEPPVIRIIEGASAEQIDAAVRAVQLINESLPSAWQLTMETTLEDSTERTPDEDEILIRFAPREEWGFPPTEPCMAARTVGCTDNNVSTETRGKRVGSSIHIDRTREFDPLMPGLIAHELLHSLGREHPDPTLYPDSIMRSSGHPNGRFALYPLDRDALYVVYDRLESGASASGIATSLGAWEQTATHVAGSIDLDDTLFGFSEFGRQRRARYGANPEIWRGGAQWLCTSLGDWSSRRASA